jgi:hypothetical protein
MEHQVKEIKVETEQVDRERKVEAVAVAEKVLLEETLGQQLVETAEQDSNYQYLAAICFMQQVEVEEHIIMEEVERQELVVLA